MDYKLINKALDEIATTYGDKNLKLSTFIEKINDYIGIREDDGEGRSGEYNSYFKIYKINGLELYIRLEYRTDSYGSGANLHNINFVQQTVKQVAVYESI